MNLRFLNKEGAADRRAQPFDQHREGLTNAGANICKVRPSTRVGVLQAQFVNPRRAAQSANRQQLYTANRSEPLIHLSQESTAHAATTRGVIYEGFNDIPAFCVNRVTDIARKIISALGGLTKRAKCSERSQAL